MLKQLILLSLLILGVIGYLTQPMQIPRSVFLVALTLGYAVWGIASHLHQKSTVPLKVVTEYLLFASIGLALTLFQSYY